MKIILDFKLKAFMKMSAMIRQCSTECAWMGVIDRKSENVFEVSDVVVFPQRVTSTHVEEDMRDDKYSMWSWELEPDVFSKLKLHGHSHVNMSVSPSGTDVEVQQMGFEEALNTGDEFRFYMIANKRGEKYFVGLVDGEEYTTDQFEIRIEGLKTMKHYMNWAKEEINNKVSEITYYKKRTALEEVFGMGG